MSTVPSGRAGPARRWLLALVVMATGCGRDGDRPIVWSYRYDDGGRVAATTDPAGRTIGVRQRGDDATPAGSVECATPAGRVAWSWDDEGRPAACVGPAGTTRYEFDDRHRLARVETDGMPAVTLSYDGHGRPAVVRVGGLDHARYAYDFLGRPAAMDTPAGRVEYDHIRFQDGRTGQKRTLPNGVVTIWKFDASGRLVLLEHATRDGTVIASYTCGYDAAGRLVTLEEWSAGRKRTRTFAYDKGQRLVSVTDAPGGGWAYEYGPLGDRTMARDPDGKATTAGHDWAGRLVEHAGRAVGRDGVGNVASIGDRAEDGFQYAADGRLVTARRGGARADYVHDGEGQLASRRTAAGTLRWVCDPMGDTFQPLVAVRDDGSRTSYLWDRGRPLGAVRYGRAEFFLADPLGSVRTVADGSGEVVARHDFDPFGVPLEPPTGDEPIPGFAGMFYDPVAALYLTPRRAYDPVLGQFLQPDPVHATPLGSAEDLSPYAYCGNDPVNLVDPTGARGARPRDRYAGYDPGSRQVAERWDARVAAGTGRRTAAITGNRVRTTYYDENGRTQAWAARNDPNADAWINQEWRRSYARARASVEGLSNEYAELVDRVGVIAAQQDPLAAALQNARQYMDQFGPPPPDLLPRPVAGDPNPRVPTFRKYDGCTGELIELGGYGPVRQVRPVQGGQGGGSDPPADPIDDGPASEPVADWSGASSASPRDAIDLSIDDIIGGVAVPRRTPVDPLANDFVGGQAVPRADVSRPRSDLAVFADAMTGTAIPPMLTPEPPVFTPRGRPRSDLEVFRESMLGPSADASPGATPGDGGDDANRVTGYTLAPPDEPAAVGGVWLGGAAAALPDVGALAGVSVDDNGRLVLLSHDDVRIDLPPLRLDDVVTVFRCVYEHGESPSVSIDNDPKNPDGPTCTVRHGPGTEETYVGWILFQCDRVLKCYTKGFDNFTGKPFRTKVPGFRNEAEIQLDIEARDPSSRPKPTDPQWRRIWIMPAAVSRERASAGSLTLLEVPLMLNTKYEELVGGDFRDVDRAPDNSWGRANSIIDRWFTDHYDDVAAEFLMVPPVETGITEPVRIFTELKRIATIAAVAEALVAQGVPMPDWMRSYPVRPCPVDKTSPWLRNVEVPIRLADGRASTVRVNGGVSLTPTDELVKTVHESPRVAAAEAPVKREMAVAPVLKPVKVSTPEQRYQAVALPGADTVDLGAARLAEADVVVPFGRGQRLELVRRFNSFFLPQGPWGKAWTPDLPALETFVVRAKSTAEGVFTRRGYRLHAPLGSVAATFRDVAVVPELGVETLVPDRPGIVLAVLGTETDPRIGAVTRRVAMRDGSHWHFFAFDDAGKTSAGGTKSNAGKAAQKDFRAGLLAGVESGPHLVAYRRDPSGRLTRIEGFEGKTSAATIDLGYDAQGRLTKATGKAGDRETEATYGYAADGVLETVTTPRGTRRYGYRDGLVASIHEGGKPVATYEYGKGGRLQAVTGADGSRVEYRLVPSADGPRMETIVTGTSGTRTTLAATFDSGMQPRERTLADGSVMSTQVLPDGAGTKTTLKLPDGRALVEESSDDGSRRDLVMPEGNRYRKEYDPETRAVTLSAGDDMVMRQRRLPDGRLEALEFPGIALRPRYDDEDRPSGVLVTGPESRESYSDWLQVDYDTAGRPVGVTDATGRKDTVARSADGRSVTLVNDGRTTTVTADAASRAVTVSGTADGSARMEFDAERRIAAITLDRDGARAGIEFADGRPVRGRLFDGGETTYEYVAADGPAKGRLERLTYPHGLVVTYAYDARGRLETATLGDVRRYRYRRDDEGRLLSFAVEPVGR